MKRITVRIKDDIRLISQDDYDRIVAWTTTVNEKGEKEVDWEVALQAMARKSTVVAPVSQEELDEEFVG